MPCAAMRRALPAPKPPAAAAAVLAALPAASRSSLAVLFGVPLPCLSAAASLSSWLMTCPTDPEYPLKPP